MRARRSRFRRFCHRLTRGTPNRKSQWQKISISRSWESSGHWWGSNAMAPRGARTFERTQWDWEPRSESQIQGEVSEVNSPSTQPQTVIPADQSGSKVAVAALTSSLLLLACAYAGLSGLMHSSSGVACLGVLGAVGSMMSAGIGVFMTASSRHRAWSTAFMSIAMLFLTGLYGAILFPYVRG